ACALALLRGVRALGARRGRLTTPATTAATTARPAALGALATTTVATARTRTSLARALAGLAEVLERLGAETGPGALAAWQPALGALGDAEVGVQVRRGGVGLHRLAPVEAQRGVDEHPARHVVPVDERHRGARVAGAGGAPDPVQVGLLVLGALVVDDVGDVVDVDAAGGDVGRHEHVDLAVAEGPQRLLARALAEVAVDGGGGEASLGELVGDLGRRALGAREHDRQATVLGLQDAGEHLDLVERVRAVDELGDRLDG